MNRPVIVHRTGTALERLQRGNRAFVKNTRNPARLTDKIRRKTARDGQNPYAVVIACSDSRVPVEHIFCAGIGELFVIRTAGNTVGELELGSVEYALGAFHPQLVLVLGHTGCGAILESMIEESADNPVIREIRPVISGINDPKRCILANIRHSISRLRSSDLVSRLEEEGVVEVRGAVYDINTGFVDFGG